MSRGYDRDYDRDYGRGGGRSRSPRRSRERGGGGGGHGRGRSPDVMKRVSLLVRNLAYDSKEDDIKKLFGKYGDVKDVYVPLNYRTKEPQGYAFVEFYDERDAEYAKRKLDREFMNGREMAVVFAKQQRKRPEEMRKIENRRPARRSGSRSRSRSRDRDRGSPSPRRRSPSPRRSRSRSPVDKKPARSRSRSLGSPPRSSRRDDDSPPPARSPKREPRDEDD